MYVELTLIDWVLVGALALLALIGLFRGLSGELGSLSGLVVAVLTGMCLYGVAQRCAAAAGFAGGAWESPVAGVIDFCFSIIAFGITRKIVSKFVSCCLGYVTNAVLGFLSGICKWVILVGLLTGIGIMRPEEYSAGIVAEHSSIVRFVADRASTVTMWNFVD